MSEAEKRRRQEYKRLRKKWILVQAIVLLVVLAIVLTMSLVYYRINKTQYVDYTEKSDIDYLVRLAPNDFYDEDTLGSDRSYVTALVERVDAEIDYELNMSAFANVFFSYTYNVEATLLIRDKYTDAVVYDAVTELVPRQYCTQNGASRLTISEAVSLNFKEYNDTAVNFLETYDLKNAACELMLTMRVDTTSKSAEFENKSTNSYFTTVTFPLAEEMSEPVTTSSAADGEVKTLACKSERGICALLVLALVFGEHEVLLFAFFLVFLFKTKTHDINYTNKVKRLVANYRSFIQRITVPFVTDGYQQIYVNSFNEMLDVRDTVASPLLMYANEDGTATTFVIPTPAKLLYVYEIRVEDYDDIYGISGAEPVEGEPRRLDLCEGMEAVWQKVKAAVILALRKTGRFFVFLARKVGSWFKKDAQKASAPKKEAPVKETPVVEAPKQDAPAKSPPKAAMTAKRAKKKKAGNKRKTKPNKKKKRNPEKETGKKTK